MEDKVESPILARLKDPLVWARLSTGIRIEDLQEKRFNEALDFIKGYFITEETLCRSVELSTDEESVECFLEAARFWMRDTTSLIAVEEGSGEIVGVLVNRVVELLERTRTFSRIRIMEKQSEAFMKVMQLRWHMHQVYDVFQHYDVDKYFRFYGICVHPHYRGKGVGMGLLKSGLHLAECMKMPVIMGVFTSARSQSLAFKLGMEMLYEQTYADWRTPDDDVIFDRPGVGNYSAIVMGMYVGGGTPKPLSLYHNYESKLDSEKESGAGDPTNVKKT